MPDELDAATLDEIERLLANVKPGGAMYGAPEANATLIVALRNAARKLLAVARENAGLRKTLLTGHQHWGFQLLESLGSFVESAAKASTPMTTNIRASFNDVDFPVLYLWATNDAQHPAARCAGLAAERDALRATSAMQTALNTQLVAGVEKLTRERGKIRKALDWAMHNAPGTPVPDWVDEVVNSLAATEGNQNKEHA